MDCQIHFISAVKNVQLEVHTEVRNHSQLRTFLYLHFCFVEYDGNLYAPQQAD